MNVVLIGEEAAGVRILQSLERCCVRVVAVMASPGINAGPIIFQESVSIGREETGLSLTAKCVDAGVPLILRLLEAAARRPSHIPSVPQDLSKREYFGRDVPENGNLSWNRPTRRIVDFIRASNFFPFRSPWGVPRTAGAAGVSGRHMHSASGSAQGWDRLADCVNTPASKP